MTDHRHIVKLGFNTRIPTTTASGAQSGSTTAAINAAIAAHVAQYHTEPDTAFYVAPGLGSSAGTGTIDDPWGSLQQFVDTNPDPGAVCYLRGGTYAESAGFSNSRDTYGDLIGTVDAPITIKNYPGEVPSFTGMANTVFSIGPNETSNTVGANYLVIDGIRFPGATISDEATIRIGGFEDTLYLVRNITIKNCYFSLTSGSASIDHCIGLIRGCEDVTIQDCEFQGSSGGQGDAIVIYDEPAALRTIIKRCTFKAWDRLAIQIWDYNTGSPTASATIQHCSFIGSSSNAVDLRHHAAVHLYDSAWTVASGSTAIYDPTNSGSTTLDHNFYSQTFDANRFLVAGQTGRSAASDGTDAGALDW